MSTAAGETTKPPIQSEKLGRVTIWREAKRFIKFCLVGLSNGAVDFVVLAVLVFVFDPQTTAALIAANTVAFLAGSINSFTWNSRLTFGTPRPYASRWFALFLLINIGGLVISNVSLVTFRWLFEAIGLEGRAAILAAKAPGAVLLAGYSYLSYRKLFLGSAGGAIVSSALNKVRGSPGP
jgi:putative flippase GtrA